MGHVQFDVASQQVDNPYPAAPATTYSTEAASNNAQDNPSLRRLGRRPQSTSILYQQQLLQQQRYQQQQQQLLQQQKHQKQQTLLMQQQQRQERYQQHQFQVQQAQQRQLQPQRSYQMLNASPRRYNGTNPPALNLSPTREAPTLYPPGGPRSPRKPGAKSPQLESRPSKMSLFSLFSKPKVETARGHSEGCSTPPSALSTPPRKQRQQQQQPYPESSPSPSPVVPVGPGPEIQKRAEAARSAASKRDSQWVSSSMLRSRPPPSSCNKDATPTYGQSCQVALKHGAIQVSAASAEALSRASSQRRQATGSTYDLTSQLPDAQGAVLSRGKVSKAQKRMSMMPTAQDLVRKFFVLQSGALLQFSQCGGDERMPEKILKLGKESAAYASDLIPGKYFVVQVSQAANDDGTVAVSQPKSLRSRLHLQSTAIRRVTNAYILVFDSADEMGSWLKAIKNEIELLGGKKAGSEVPAGSRTRPGPEKEAAALAKRDLNSVSIASPSMETITISSPTDARNTTPDADRHQQRPSLNDVASTTSSSLLSTEASSAAPTIFSSDHSHGHHRDAARLSYVSNATSHTIGSTASRASSPLPPSPHSDDHSSDTDMEVHNAGLKRRSRMSSAGSGLSGHRRSIMMSLPATQEDDCQIRDAARDSVMFPDTGSLSRSSPRQDCSLFSARNFSRPNLRSHSTDCATTGRRAGSPEESNGSPVDSKMRPLSLVGNAQVLNSRQERNRTIAANRVSFRPIPVRPADGSPPKRLSSMPRAPQLAPALPETSLFAPTSKPDASLRHGSIADITREGQLQQPVDSQASRRMSRSPSQLQQIAADSNPVSPTSMPMSVSSSRRTSSNSVISPTDTIMTAQVAQVAQIQTLRRPTSMQIRSNRAAFLANSRNAANASVFTAPPTGPPTAKLPEPPTHAGNRKSLMAGNPSKFEAGVPIGTGIERPQSTLLLGPAARLQARRSMPSMGLPPPAPPPNVPLPEVPTEMVGVAIGV